VNAAVELAGARDKVTVSSNVLVALLNINELVASDNDHASPQ